METLPVDIFELICKDMTAVEVTNIMMLSKQLYAYRELLTPNKYLVAATLPSKEDKTLPVPEYCKKIGGFWNDVRVTDDILATLHDAHTVTLQHLVKVTDIGISKLGKVHSLNLCIMPNVTERGISHLHDVHELELCKMDNVTTDAISKLGNGKMHTLKLWMMEQVDDDCMYHLGKSKIHTLILQNLSRVSNDGILMLGNIHTLYIWTMSQITLDRKFGNIQCLYINGRLLD